MEKEKYSTERKKQSVIIAVKYKTEGKTYAEIGKSLGVTPMLIRKWIMAETGIKPEIDEGNKTDKLLAELIKINKKIEADMSKIFDVIDKVPEDILGDITADFDRLGAFNGIYRGD